MLTKLVLLFAFTSTITLSQLIEGIDQLTCSQPDLSPVLKRVCDLLGFSTEPVSPIFTTRGCEKQLNSTHCQVCQKQYLLFADSGECVLARTIEPIQDPIDIDEPFIDLIDQFQQLYGSSSRKANQFNIRNHPDLQLSSISEGLSISGRIGIYNTLYYKNPSFQTAIITITNCDGSINEIFYSVNEDHFTGPLSLIRYIFEQNAALDLYALRYIGNNQFMIFLSNIDSYLKVQYNFGATNFRSFVLQPSNLIQILEPIGQQKLISQNYQFNSIQFPIKQNRNNIIFEDNTIVLGIQVIGCKILVNQILPKDVIIDSQKFFENYEQALFSSLISNIPPIRNVSLIQGSNDIYNIELKFPDIQFQQQPIFDIVLTEQNGESMFIDFSIDKQSVTGQIKQIEQEISLQLPHEETDSNVIFPLSDIFCQQYNLEQGCTKCVTGYKIMFRGGHCITQQCLQYSEIQCVVCDNGFHLFNGDCKINQPFCLDYHLITGKCKLCQKGYSLDKMFQCEKEVNQIQFCQIQDNQGGCLRCIDSYQLRSPTSCLAIIQIQGCLQINRQSNRCQICHADYTLDIISGKCNRRVKGCTNQQIVTTSGQCVDEKCIEVNDGICISCIDRYYAFDNVCLKVNDLCLEYEMKSGECTSCRDSFSLVSGACVEQAIFCLRLQGNTCVQCPFRAYLFRDKCYPVNDQCRKWNNENGDCQQCYGGYYLISGVCLIGQDPRTDKNCLFKESLYCEICKQGFFPARGYCIPLIQNCQQHDRTTGQCLRCQFDYILSENILCIYSPA